MCGNASVLATSRRPIGVEGEYVRPVSPLSHEEAVSLFVQRARLAGVATSRATRSTRSALDSIGSRSRSSSLRASSESWGSSRSRRVSKTSCSSAVAGQRSLRGNEPSTTWWRGATTCCRQTHNVYSLAWACSLRRSRSRPRRPCAEWAPSATSRPSSITPCLRGVPTSTSSLSRNRMLETLRLFALGRLVASGADELDAARRAHADFYRRMAMRAGEHLWGADEQLCGSIWRLRSRTSTPHSGGPRTTTPSSHFASLSHSGRTGTCDGASERASPTCAASLDRPDLDVDDARRAWALTVSADLSAKNPGDARQSIPWATEAIRRSSASSATISAFDTPCWHWDLASATRDGSTRPTPRWPRPSSSEREHGDKVVIARGLNHVSFIASRRGNFVPRCRPQP